MRFALATMLAAGLVLATTARAQETARLVDLSRQVANGALDIKNRQAAPAERPRKLGERVLRGLFTEDRDRINPDPVYQRFDEAANDLVSAAIELDRHASRGGSYSNIDEERRFIRQFRQIERLAMDVDRVLPGSRARTIFIDDVKPAMHSIRRELPTLSAFRDREERRDFYRRDFDRM